MHTAIFKNCELKTAKMSGVLLLISIFSLSLVQLVRARVNNSDSCKAPAFLLIVYGDNYLHFNLSTL